MFGLPVRVAQIFFMRPADMCENSYIDPAAINEIKKVKNKVWDYYKQEKVE